MKEKIHALSEEMVANLGRLVAIDSQLGTPAVSYTHLDVYKRQVWQF